MTCRNMLGAQKVKLHGMTSSKWTTRDKITQFKGLINLYTRDKKLIEKDLGYLKKRQSNEIKNLQKEIEQNRKDLDNASRGNRQKLRNTLSEHRELQLAFQNSQPKAVIEQVIQLNFNKRKTRDRLKYRMKLKSDELIDLKLKQALYEDRVKWESVDWQHMLPCEKQSHMITGMVQDAILKKEAAIYIRNSYNRIIAVMKKDALYFDAILVTIYNDGLEQGKCILNATKMGQLGMEYLDDRRQEYQILEKIVKQDLITRREDLKKIQNDVEKFSQNMKCLIRRDSDINLGKIEIENTQSFIELKNEFSDIKATLTFLKTAIFTPTIESIYPCIQEQSRQKERLKEFVEKCEKNRDDLIKRNKHASLTNSNMKNTMVDTTAQYVTDKIELNENITKNTEQIKELEKLVKNRHILLANVTRGLKHLQLIATLLNKPKTPPQTKSRKLKVKSKTELTSSILDLEITETDAVKIIPELITKFTKLTSNTKEILKGQETIQGYRSFELMMKKRTETATVDKVISEEDIMESMFFADAHVLTREDIKKQSAEIVAANQSCDDFTKPPPTKKFVFKKK